MRLEDWQFRLDRYLKECADRKFQWGFLDCALFACGAIEAVTGKDLGKSFRGKYSTKKGATQTMRTFAGKGSGMLNVASKMARRAGFRKIAPAMAQRGDVVAVRVGHRVALGVVMLDGHRVALMHADGMVRESLSSSSGPAWRIE